MEEALQDNIQITGGTSIEQADTRVYTSAAQNLRPMDIKSLFTGQKELKIFFAESSRHEGRNKDCNTVFQFD